MQTPVPARAAGKDGRRTSHVRFCTPAPPAYVPLPTPSQTAGVNSCNAGRQPPLAQHANVLCIIYCVGRVVKGCWCPPLCLAVLCAIHARAII